MWNIQLFEEMLNGASKKSAFLGVLKWEHRLSKWNVSWNKICFEVNLLFGFFI